MNKRLDYTYMKFALALGSTQGWVRFFRFLWDFSRHILSLMSLFMDANDQSKLAVTHKIVSDEPLQVFLFQI
jgi:hypothetical protein